jgi:hypothetical protein
MMRRSANRDDGLPSRRILLLAGGFIVIWAVGATLLYFLLPTWEVRGQFGDMFGAANALFSGGALVGVVLAIAMQRRELQLQRQELDLTRQELERSAVAQESSAGRLLEQTQIQTALLNAQLLRDRLEAYWKTYQPVTDAQVAELRLYPEDYMDRELFRQRYARDEPAIRRYIYMSLLYEYLGFTHKLPALGVPDPLGAEWVRRWTNELLACAEFRDVHEQYRGYLPEYEGLVDELMARTRQGV